MKIESNNNNGGGYDAPATTKGNKMGLLVIYAVFVTLYAIGMTIEYANLHGFRRGYDEGYSDAKEVEHCGHGQCCQ